MHRLFPNPPPILSSPPPISIKFLIHTRSPFLRPSISHRRNWSLLRRIPAGTPHFPSIFAAGIPSRHYCSGGIVVAGDGDGGGGGRRGWTAGFVTGVGLGVVVVGVACATLVVGCSAVVAAEGAGSVGIRAVGKCEALLKVAWPMVLQALLLFREHGLVLTALLGLSAFFSMAETAITTLWPWKIRELAEKEPDNGVFRILRSDVNRFLTTILIGTTVANIGATAIVTDAATAIFGEAGVSAATGVMTVAVLLLTEITPKSIAVHNATEVARIVVRPVAWLSVILYPVGKVATFLSMGLQKMLGLKARSEPYVTEDELKLMLKGAELSGAIEEEEQDMIENVLEIKDTHVKEVMTPLVDVVAIDASAKLIDFQKQWVTCQYSRVPVFEERVDNIVGIAYAMDMLEYVEKVEQLDESTVGDIVHKPTYFVPDSMSVWNLLREFRIRKVHMAVVLNEYGGTVGIVTLEDVVEEIVGEIYDENDSKEEIQKRTGYIVMLKDGSFCVDANTEMDQLSKELDVKIPEGHQYETVSGYICESFGCIPSKGDKMKVVLEKADKDGNSEFTETELKHQEDNERYQIFELEILEANARKVESVLFKLVNDPNMEVDNSKGVNRVISKKVVKRKRRNDANSGISDSDEPSLSEKSDDEHDISTPFLEGLHLQERYSSNLTSKQSQDLACNDDK